MPFDIVVWALGIVQKIAGPGGGLAAGRLLFRVEPDQKACETRYKPKIKGWPWSDQVGIHVTSDGTVHMFLVKAPANPADP